ncbi:portal protein [bacterium]|nr:portal protein [bacterium]
MAIKLFGFKIGKDEPEQSQPQSFVPKAEDDGAVAISAGGVYGTYVDLEGQIRSDSELINKYREMAMQPECDLAIDDIVNEAIVYEEHKYPVEIVLDELKQPESIKKKIRDEYSHIMKLLDFNNMGYDIFRRWYIDGRLYYHMIIDEKNPRLGLREVRYIDPRKIRKIREAVKKKDPTGVAQIYSKPNEYYIFSDKGFAKDGAQGLKIAADSICYVHCGQFDKDGKVVISHLHKAIKPLNQLRMLEDATVIYRISRAPERRIFYIDVGNLPKMKAEQYLREMMQKYKNKLVYDAQTGEIRDDRRFQTMLEDFWLPRREGGKGTEISTLAGGQNLGEIEDVLYFQKKLYKSLNVPISRLEADNGFSLGRASEISRDEIKFSKFISRLRLRFTHLFDKLLETQLLLKGVCTRAEWLQLKEEINYDFISDSYFVELKRSEIMKDRLGLLGEIDSYVGKYFSVAYIRKNILRQSEDEIENMDKEMEEDKANMEDEPVEAPPPPSPVAPPPQEVVVSVKKEETESRTVDDTDQKELAKSMTRFFETLTEETKHERGEK